MARGKEKKEEKKNPTRERRGKKKLREEYVGGKVRQRVRLRKGERCGWGERKERKRQESEIEEVTGIWGERVF